MQNAERTAPKERGKNSSLIPKERRARKRSAKSGRSEWDLFLAYRLKVIAIAGEAECERLDLHNDFHWLFRLEEFMSRARKAFAEINAKFFSGLLPEPKIIYCARLTGGYYNKALHTIGISLPMTVEFGEEEFLETLLHEIAHISIHAHSPKFYQMLRAIGGSGRKAPVTTLLAIKRTRHMETKYPVIVECPSCQRQQRYRSRRALHYACKFCCTKYADGKFDPRFQFVEVKALRE